MPPSTRDIATPPPAAAGSPTRQPLFSAAAQALLRPRPPIRPSQWSERNRWVYESAIPGPWRNDNAPYLRGMMDIPMRPGCIEVNIKKATRVGASECARNVIGYCADYEPDPIGLNLPDRSTGRKAVKRDVLPMFTRTACLRALRGRDKWDQTTEIIRLLNGFRFELMWAGSATSTADRTLRRVFNDEVDKMVVWAGGEADPIGRTTSRTRTYGYRRLIWNQSSPTTDLGMIHRLFEASTIKLYYFVPCPHCGHYQRLTFPQLRWRKFDQAEGVPAEQRPADKNELADRIVREGACWYECVACQGRITEQDKPAMVRAGRWTTNEGYVVDADGVVHEDAEKVEAWPTGTRIGMHISQLYCLWVPWSDIAAGWLRADGDLIKQFNFRTEVLGEVWEFRVSRVSHTVFSDKVGRARLAPGLVPAWASVLLAGIDTQADHFYYVVRAFGHGCRSARVAHGRLRTFGQLDELLFLRGFAVEANVRPPMTVALAVIDSGGGEDQLIDRTRTQQVYDWVLPRQPRVLAVKGSPRLTGRLCWRSVPPSSAAVKAADRRRAPEGLQLWNVDSHACNDVLAGWIEQGLPEPSATPAASLSPAASHIIAAVQASGELWQLNRQDDPEYDAHLAGMHKVLDPVDRRSTAAPMGRWRAIHSGGRVDYRMCEAYLVAAAYMAEVHTLPTMAELEQMTVVTQPASAPAAEDVHGFTPMPL